MVTLIDNTAIMLAHSIKAIPLYMDIDEEYDDVKEHEFTKGTYVNDEYHIELPNQFTIICSIAVVEVLYGHKFTRDIFVNELTVLDEGGYVAITEQQFNLFKDTIQKLITIKNSLK